MTDGRFALRATATLAVGGFVLHQLRYVLGYGELAPQALSAHGHGYMALLTPLIALLVAVAAGQFLAQLATARETGTAGRRLGRFGGMWAVAAGVLFATYAGQELLEGLMSSGHPGGVEAVLAGGGWWSIPLALAVGLVVALLLRGADACLALVARRRESARRTRPAAALRPESVDLSSPSVLAGNLAGRAPPLARA